MSKLAKPEPISNGRDYACGPNTGENPDVEIGRFGIDKTDPAVIAEQQRAMIAAQMAEAKKIKEAAVKEYMSRGEQ